MARWQTAQSEPAARAEVARTKTSVAMPTGRIRGHTGLSTRPKGGALGQTHMSPHSRIRSLLEGDAGDQLAGAVAVQAVDHIDEAEAAGLPAGVVEGRCLARVARCRRGGRDAVEG